MADGTSSLAAEHQDLIRRAQKQPGIKELTEAYGYYDRIATQSAEYFARTGQKIIVSVSSSSP
jgi:hypothetical protein